MFKSIFYFRNIINIMIFELFQSFVEKIYFKYFLVKSYIFIYKDNILSLFTNTKQVKGFINGIKKDMTYKYYTFHFLTYLRSYFDERVDTLHIIKKYNEQEFPIIINKNNKDLTFDKILKIDNKEKKNYDTKNGIYIKFELIDNNNKIICLKKYLI